MTHDSKQSGLVNIIHGILGNPRYLPTPPSLLISRICYDLAMILWRIFAEKVMEDLSLLIFWPNAAS